MPTTLIMSNWKNIATQEHCLITDWKTMASTGCMIT